MAAIFSTLYEAMECGYPIKTALFTVATTGDWFKMSAPGVIPLSTSVISSASSGYAATPYYAGLSVKTTATATATSLVVTGAPNPWTVPHGDFYLVTTGGEIMFVTHYGGYGSGTNGTCTVIRGCLGTTATATGVTAGSMVYIMNVIKFSNQLAILGPLVPGKIIMAFMELPSDPKAHVFPQA